MSDYLRILDTKFSGDFDPSPYNPKFELDDFQKHAIKSIKNKENVLVTAHTGSGKTVPAIFSIADSLQKNKKIIYTSPIKSLSNQKLFEGKHKAYFESWDNGAYFNNPKYVVTHDSNGLFLSDFNKYFSEFKNSFILVPIRDCIGYVAAEKTRIARRFFGSKRFSKPLPPNFLIKKFDAYDLNSIINTWLISISRIKLLQEKTNSKNNLITYRFEKLAEQTSDSMKILSNKLKINYENNLLSPTLCGNKWLGNSQQGKNYGINPKPNLYFKNILREDEINQIKSKIQYIDRAIQEQTSFEVDFKNLDDKYFFDITNQRKASLNTDTWSIYCALGYSGFRKLKLSKSNHISLIAYIFSIFVMICHFPRLLKQRLFPGLGKQNYT